MAFKMNCPHCMRRLNVTEKAFGKTVPCPGCSQPLTIPQQPVNIQGTPMPVTPPPATLVPPVHLPPGMPPLPDAPTPSPNSVDGGANSFDGKSDAGAAQIKLPCPYCGDSIKYEESLGGKTITCRYCKRPLKMPFLAQLAPEYQEEFRHQQDKLRKKAEAAEQKRIRAQQRESERESAAFLRQQELERRAEEARLRQQVEAAQQQEYVKAIHAGPTAPAPTADANSVRCPKCGCTQLSTQKKGMSGGCACCGALLVGPLGLLCGLKGANKVIITCLKCGHQWSRG